MQTQPATAKLAKEALSVIHDLAQKLATVKGMLPISHPAQNQASFDIEKITSKLEKAAKSN